MTPPLSLLQLMDTYDCLPRFADRLAPKIVRCVSRTRCDDVERRRLGEDLAYHGETVSLLLIGARWLAAIATPTTSMKRIKKKTTSEQDESQIWELQRSTGDWSTQVK
jgi:hypothetical protein